LFFCLTTTIWQREWLLDRQQQDRLISQKGASVAGGPGGIDSAVCLRPCKLGFKWIAACGSFGQSHNEQTLC